MSRRIKNPSHLATILFAAAAGAGIYWWSSSAKAAGKAAKKKKKLTSDKPPRINKVQTLPSFDDVDDLAAPPWMILVHCDTTAGRAALAQFSQLAKTTSKNVTLYSLINKSPEECNEDAVPSGLTPVYDAAMYGQRLNGSWLEAIAGEDQAEAAIYRRGSEGDAEANAARIRAALAWASGEGTLPLERAVWVGDPDLLWAAWDEQPTVVQTVIGNMYELPVKPPKPDEPVKMSNQDEALVASDVGIYQEDAPADIPPGTQFVMITPLETTVATMISLEQGDWKRQALIRAKPA